MARYTLRREGGQVIVVLAVLSVALFGLASIAVDSGVAAADRRDLQSYSDAAALAGAAEYNILGGDANSAHFVALSYIQKSLHAASFPSGCTVAACPAGTYTFTGGYTVILQDPSSNSLDVSMKHSQPSFLAGVLGFRNDVDATSGRAEPVTPGQVGAVYAVAAVGGNADVHVNGGGVKSNPTGDVGGPVFADGDYGANNGPHSTQVTSYISGYGGTSSGTGTSVCDSPSVANHVDLGDNSDGLNYDFTGTAGSEVHSVGTPAANTSFQALAPTTTGPTFTTVASAKDGAGNWKPGTYSGISPNGGALNAGVYVIKNYTGTISPGHNVTNPGRGQEDVTGAVSIVLNATDTGTLDLNSAQLNGLDDLNPTVYTGPRDPLGTHNFAIWGGTFAGTLSAFEPHNTADITGILFLPNQDLTEHGNAAASFAGSVWVKSVTIDGGGNGTQVFAWVCGLRAISPAASGGGLTR